MDIKFSNSIDAKEAYDLVTKLQSHFVSKLNELSKNLGENKDFEEVADLLTDITGERIRFNSINPISFYFRKKKERLKSGFALVMTILHFLPRLQP